MYWVDRFGNKCNDCGESFPLCVYDFHHVDGSKELNPSKAMALSFEVAEREMSKCIMLCANCHRIRHFGGGEFNDTTTH